jgi:DNA-binding Lrp family transcriptional regulator
MRSTELDETDRAILRELQNNARIQNKDLARAVALSPSSCLQRVRALQERGAIVGYRAEIDPALLGRNLDAYIAVRFRGQSQQTVERFERDLMRLPEVLSLAHVTGDDDVLMQVSVRDVPRLRAFILEQLTSRTEVAHIKTNLIFAQRRRTVIEPLPD